MSIVMFKGKIFTKLNGLIGILSFTFMLVFEFCTSFIPALDTVATILVMFGGILSIVWGILTGLKLFHLAQSGE